MQTIAEHHLRAPRHEPAHLLLRASSLTWWDDCPRRGAARLFPRIAGEAGYTLRSIASGIGSKIGTAVHAGAAFTLRCRMTNGDSGAPGEASQTAIHSLETAAKEDETRFDDLSPNLDVARKQTVRLLGVYRRDVAPTISPAAVERRLDAEIFPGVALSGQVDAAANGGILRDLKTSVTERANGPQYGAYALLWEAHGFEITRILEDHVPRVRVTAEQPPARVIAYNPAQAKNAAYRIAGRIDTAYLTFAGNGDPEAFPANPNSILCGEKWCSAWGTAFCRAHKGA